MYTVTRCWLGFLAIGLLILPALVRAEGLSKTELARLGKAATVFVSTATGTGSGFCIHPSGLFLTNQHVVANGGDIQLVLNANQKNQQVLKARVVRSDREADLALLQAEGVKEVPALALGADENLAEGADVLACGFPFGQRLAVDRKEYPAISVHFGRVTALTQKASELERIQVDVGLYPGNSGGPVLDAQGKVIGVVVAGVRGAGINFAIPARKVRRFVEQPTVVFQPPALDRGNLHKPVRFEVRTVSILPAAKPFEVELLLRRPNEKEQRHRLTRDGDTHRVETVLFPPSAAPELRLTLTFADGSLAGAVSDASFKVGERALKLSDVRGLEIKGKTRAVLTDGTTVEGTLTGLDALPVRIAGQTFAVNVGKAVEAVVDLAGPAQAVQYTFVVSRDGKELARTSNWIVNEDQIRKVYLVDLPEIEYRRGPWDLGKGNLHGTGSSPITFNGTRSPKGLSTHPDCSISYRIKKGALLFKATVGLNDFPGSPRTSDVLFALFGDGRLLWQSKPINARGETDACVVDVAAVDKLELRVTAKGNNFHAHAVWLEPHVLLEGGTGSARVPLLRPEPTVAIPDKDKVVIKLPALVSDVAVGAGGRYLILALPTVRKLAVFDVVKAEVVKYLDLEDGSVRIAAGADKLLVLHGGKKVLDRWSLTTFQKEASIDVPFNGQVTALVLGCAAHGPLLVTGEAPGLRGEWQFLDVQTMRRVTDLTIKGPGGAHTGDGTTLFASADGKVFGVCSTNFFSRGTHTNVCQGNEVTSYPIGIRLLHAQPSPDGRTLFTNDGLYTEQWKDPERGPSHRGALCLPAVQGAFYLKAPAGAEADGFSLCVLGEDEPLVRVTGVGWPQGGQGLGYFKRIHLLPAADRIVTIPAGNDTLVLHRFDFARTLEKATGDYLFVTSFAPPVCRKGMPYVYAPRVHSKKGGVKYRIDAGPPGMTVSESGQLRWNVPADYGEALCDVTLRVADSSGQEVFQTFRIRVDP